jgi:hypothetical protein
LLGFAGGQSYSIVGLFHVQLVSTGLSLHIHLEILIESFQTKNLFLLLRVSRESSRKVMANNAYSTNLQLGLSGFKLIGKHTNSANLARMHPEQDQNQDETCEDKCLHVCHQYVLVAG